jgi:putative ABC transport system permease protein
MSLAQDLRIAVRQLRKAPGFSITIILTLALGIGATTAIFSLVEGILLRPLPFADADRLVILGDRINGGQNTTVTAREIATYSTATSAFSSMGGYITATYELSDEANPEEIHAARVTSGVFPTLGVQPIIGRVFTHQEEDTHEPVAVISYSLWVNRYGRDPHVAGRSITLDRRPYSMIGVMPRSFEFPLQPGLLNDKRVWVPMSFTPVELSEASAGFWAYHIVARLKNGVSQRQAAEDADRVSRQIMAAFPPSISAIRIRGDQGRYCGAEIVKATIISSTGTPATQGSFTIPACRFRSRHAPFAERSSS